MNIQVQEWITNASQYLIQSWGLSSVFASKVALFLAYLYQYSLSPKITSGFRSPVYQKELLARYNAGDKSIVVKPAENSKHTIMYDGKPASRAIDIVTSNPALAAVIAKALNINAGYDFKTPDPVHFYI